MLITILATIVVLGVLILVHELGHFLTAKAVDIEVPRFSIGLGPKLIGFKRGETEYVISWLPLGGYVKMAGMEEMEKLEGGPSKPTTVTGTLTAEDLGVEVETKREAGPRDFESKSLPARALVISAGVLMNLLFAVVVFASIALIWGVQTVADSRIGNVSEERLPAGTEALAGIPVGARVTSIGGENVNTISQVRQAIFKLNGGPTEIQFESAPPITITLPSNEASRDTLASAFEPAVPTRPIIGEVVADLPAARGGLKANDLVTSVDGRPLGTWQDFVAAVEAHPGKPMNVGVTRDGAALTVVVTPEAKDLRGKLSYGRLGVYPKQQPEDALPRERPGLIGAVGHGFTETWGVVVLTADFLGDLFTGKTSARNVGGPIQIGQLSGRVARLGLEPFLTFMALFSVNLAVLNLLPIPVLDGGHLMFLLVEGVRGRALSLEQRMRLSQVGFVIVLAIMVWAVANDVLKLFGL
jgi:regulator of sigma E protease